MYERGREEGCQERRGEDMDSGTGESRSELGAKPIYSRKVFCYI